jgi:anaerobic selenocysteine-containing dehydrogenase
MADELTEHRSFCRFCQALCGIVVRTRGDQVVDVRGDTEHPLSRGYTCPKGRALGAWHHHPDRIDVATVRAGDRVVATGWEATLDDLGARLDRIRHDSGNDAIAIFFGTGSSFDAAGGRIAAAFHHGLGSRSRYTARTLDTPCRPLVSDLMGGHPSLIPAIDHDTTTMIVFVGTNPVVSHGHLASLSDPVVRLRHLSRDGREVWVLDPRRTETARLANRHLAVRPGGDYAVFAHAIRALLPEVDRAALEARADGVERLERAVAPFDRDTAAAIAGLEPSDLDEFVAAVRRHGRLAVLTGTGATMAPAANVTEWLTRALQVVTDSFEQPGGLWFNPGFSRGMDQRTIRPSPPELRNDPGPASRPELAPRYGELPCAALADEIEAGNVRALLVVGGNIVNAFPDRARFTRALGMLDVLACVDVVETETTRRATHVLPAAGQLERADIPDYVDQYQNLVASQHTAAVVPCGGERKPVWWIFGQLGRRLGVEAMPAGLDVDTATDDDLLARFAARGALPFDEVLASPTGVTVGGPRRGWVRERVLPEGRWRVAPPDLVAQLESLTSWAHLDAPASSKAGLTLALIPGRQLRTLNSALRDVAAPGGRLDRNTIVLHPADAAAAGIAEGEDVTVHSRFGRCSGECRLDDTMRRGVVHVPHGWNEPGVNFLTSDTVHVDPLTGMPQFTAVPVEVRRTGAVSR